MLVKVSGSAVSGIDAQAITVEVDMGQGANAQIIGLPDNAVKESLTRIYAALKNSGYRFPRQGLIINMAPADLKKQGSAYDLTIALGILIASGQLIPRTDISFLLMGELSLDGGILPISGSLPMAIQALRDGHDAVLLPAANAREAAIVDGLEVYGCRDLRSAVAVMEGNSELSPTSNSNSERVTSPEKRTIDLADVKGQGRVKRAIEVAAAGGHNILLIGPPGSGKTMLARRIPSILPPMEPSEALETTKIHSVAGLLGPGLGLMEERPFRSPHHTISESALVGGGHHPQPGELSLAHHGILFLDELPEFKRHTLEVLRQPLEERSISIARSRNTVEYPCNVMLVASMNPCPCGYYNDPNKECSCPPGIVHRYLSRVSGPMLDRIDLHVEVQAVEFEALLDARPQEESSATVRKRVITARQRQMERFQRYSAQQTNASMAASQLKDHCQPDPQGVQLLRQAVEQLQLSARAYDRILKVSRTIADLANSDRILAEHIAEAIQYRSLDRQAWGA